MHGQRPAVPQLAEQLVRHADRPARELDQQAAVARPGDRAGVPVAEPAGQPGWLATATTRSPGSNPPWPPGPGLSCCLSARFSSAVPAGPWCTGVITWMSAAGMPSARGIESVTSWITRCVAVRLSGTGTTTTSRSADSTRGRVAAAHRGGQPGDVPAVALPVQPGQLGHRHHAGLDEVGQHLARPDRRQLSRVAGQQQPGAVGARLDQRGGQLGVQHGRLVHHHQAGVQRLTLAAGEHPAAGAALRAEQPVHGRRGRAGQLSQPPGGPAGRRGQRQLQAAAGRHGRHRRDRPALAGARPTGQHGHAVLRDRAHRLLLGFVDRIVLVAEHQVGRARHRPGQRGQPLHALGHRVLGHRVPGQRQHDTLAVGLIIRGVEREHGVQRQHGALVHGGLHGLRRVVDPEPGQRAGDHPGGHRGVPVPGRPAQQVAGQRAAPPRVLRRGPGAQHPPGKPVRLVRPDLRQQQQPPGVLAQLLAGARAEHRHGQARPAVPAPGTRRAAGPSPGAGPAQARGRELRTSSSP